MAAEQGKQPTDWSALGVILAVIWTLVVGLPWLRDQLDQPDPAPTLPAFRTQSNFAPVFDLDCVDLGGEIWVGAYDPYGLDADGDGWGCEAFGG